METYLQNNYIYKYGSDENIISKVFNYFKDLVPDPGTQSAADKFINFISPGIILTTLASCGFPKIGFLLAEGISLFGIDISSIFSEIYDKIKNLLSNNNKPTSNQIQNVIDNAIDNNTNKDLPKDSIHSIYEKYNNLGEKLGYKSSNEESGTSNVEDNIITAKSIAIYNRKIKLANITGFDIKKYNQNFDNLILKEASLLDWFSFKRNKSTGFLKNFLGLFFKIALGSLLLLAVKDAVYRLIPGLRPENKQNLSNSEGPSIIEPIFPVKENIENLLIKYVKEYYPNLKQEDIIKYNNFNKICNEIMLYNIRGTRENFLLIPLQYKSKKQIADLIVKDS